MIDSHCHLTAPQFTDDVDAVIARATEAGVERLITIADTLEDAEACIALGERHSNVCCTVGLHPHTAKEWKPGDDGRLRSLWMRSPEKVRAIGEIGLDYHYDYSPRDTQREVFRTQLAIATELGLPAVVHCREAIADVRAILEEIRPKRVVIHCCTEVWEDVEPLVAAGCFLSFTGIATYPAAEEVRRTIRMCPIEQMMIETDAPYLAPVPHRGKRNEPAFVAEVLRCVAREKGIAEAEAEAILTRNTVEFFSLEP